MDEAPTCEQLPAVDSNILKARLLLTKPANSEATEKSATSQDGDQNDSSDVMFVSASSQVPGGLPAEENSSNPLDGDHPPEESSSHNSLMGNQVSSVSKEADQLANGVANHKNGQEKPTGELPSNSGGVKPAASKKGPPPGLLPIEPIHNLPPESPEGGRIPRKAAVKSAERTKVVAQLENTPNNYDLAPLEEAKGLTDADATEVKIYKVLDPVPETCHWCYKNECCLYQTTGRQSKTDLKFCSRRCVQNFFKYGNIHFANSTAEDDKNATSSKTSTGSTPEVDIVVEPDIEIQTLSDEFQIDCDDPEPCHAAIDADIDAAAKESVCCWSCKASLIDRMDTLVWESMEFCSEKCLRTCVKVIGSHCNTCNSQVADNFLGKLCVRFGTVIRQFCAADCLEKFKHNHKLCAQCQTNMVDKDKKFCSPACEELAVRLQNPVGFLGVRSCAVCTEVKPIVAEVAMTGQSHFLCSKPCRNAFRFANKLTTLKCGICNRYFDARATPRYLTRSSVLDSKGRCLTEGREQQLNWFCSGVCFATHLLRKRSIEQCPRCLVKKYNVDMIRKPTGKIITPSRGAPEPEMVYYCSLFCYSSHQPPQSRELVSAVRKKQSEVAQLQQKVPPTPSQPVAAPAPPVKVSVSSAQTHPAVAPPVASQATTVPSRPLQEKPAPSPANVNSTGLQGTSGIIPIDVQHKVVLVPPRPKEMRNKAVWCRPSHFTPPASSFAVETKQSKSTETSTNQESSNKQPLYIPVLIPVPVPIYVPVPMAMFNFPVPCPFAFPLPVPTPVLMPFEPELADRIAAAIKESKKEADEAEAATSCNELRLSPEPEETVGEEPEPVEDLEQGLPTYVIQLPVTQSRKRSLSTSHSSTPSPKRARDSDSMRCSSDGEESSFRSCEQLQSPGHLRSGDFLKELGSKAWSRWLAKRKANGSKTATDLSGSCKISQFTLAELNSSLIEFASGVRKPTGETYRPDVLLYFTYGLQVGLIADGRRENLFMDAALEPFQVELDAQLKPFYDSLLEALANDSGSSGGNNPLSNLTTCLKESDLWDCRQLGVDSPIVLVFTMLYFNTKFFRLYTAEQHEQLSFSDIQKVPQKRTSFISGSIASQNGSPSSTSCKAPAKVFSLQLIQSFKPSLMNGPRVYTKKPMEQPQIVERPGICPVKHYNFYVMKCPESVKTRRDVFYLLPESSSTPDSAVWYSTQPVPRPIIARMLRRVVLVEEVIRSLCTSD